MADVIGFDPVPLSVNGGYHDGSLLRLLGYAATSGEKGVIQPADCRVTQLSSAGPQVAIGIGAVSIPNAFNDSAENYVAHASSESRLDVGATLGSGRSDLVVVRVYDPEFSAENAPPVGQEPTWQYARPIVIPSVPSGTETAEELDLGYPAVELARIDLPPNTTNITSGMIKDLRQIARPRSKIVQQTITHDTGYSQALISSPWNPWATSANQTIFIPPWAKRVIIEVLFGGVKNNAGGTWGGLRARLGSSGSAFSVVTREIGYDVNTPAANNYDRSMQFVADTLTLTDEIRGTSQPFGIEGRKYGGDTSIEIDQETVISTKLTFEETIA